MATLRKWKAAVSAVGMLVWLCLFSAGVGAASSVDAKKETPHAVVEEVTGVMFDIVKEHNGGEGDTEAYYQAIEDTLEPVVDFEFIAKAVMGEHRKKASEEQVERFVGVFKKGLVTTYAKGIASYIDSDIKIESPDKDLSDKRRVSVDQKVTHEGSTYNLSYTMAQNRAGEWKLINLVLDGVNLGRSFRSQFGQAVKKYDGDIDKVINNWLDEM